jgi:hypothetical protein
MENVVEVLKWIGIVVAAGFVGYFGRYLAMWIIEKIRRNKALSTAVPEPKKEIPPSPEVQIEQARMKMEKKKVKAEAKKAKKGGEGRVE